MLSNGFILQESGITNSHFHNNNLMQTVVNLMFAGTDTTATTLRWGLLFMAKNPKIQGKELKISSIFLSLSNKVLYNTTTVHRPGPGGIEQCDRKSSSAG